MTTKLSFCVELNYDGYYELKAYDPNGSEIPARKLADFDFEKLNATISNHDHLVEALKQMLNAYCELVNSGDAGRWDPEGDQEVINSRWILAELGEKNDNR